MRWVNDVPTEQGPQQREGEIMGLVLWAYRAKASTDWHTYHHVFVTPKLEHPTSSQYVFALSTEATARLRVGPLTGQPVSVIQTGFPPTAALVASKALLNRDWPLPMAFDTVSFALVSRGRSKFSVVVCRITYLEIRIRINSDEITCSGHCGI